MHTGNAGSSRTWIAARNSHRCSDDSASRRRAPRLPRYGIIKSICTLAIAHHQPATTPTRCLQVHRRLLLQSRLPFESGTRVCIEISLQLENDAFDESQFGVWQALQLQNVSLGEFAVELDYDLRLLMNPRFGALVDV